MFESDFDVFALNHFIENEGDSCSIATRNIIAITSGKLEKEHDLQLAKIYGFSGEKEEIAVIKTLKEDQEFEDIVFWQDESDTTKTLHIGITDGNGQYARLGYFIDRGIRGRQIIDGEVVPCSYAVFTGEAIPYDSVGSVVATQEDEERPFMFIPSPDNDDSKICIFTGRVMRLINEYCDDTDSVNKLCAQIELQRIFQTQKLIGEFPKTNPFENRLRARMKKYPDITSSLVRFVAENPDAEGSVESTVGGANILTTARVKGSGIEVFASVPAQMTPEKRLMGLACSTDSEGKDNIEIELEPNSLLKEIDLNDPNTKARKLKDIANILGVDYVYWCDGEWGEITSRKLRDILKLQNHAVNYAKLYEDLNINASVKLGVQTRLLLKENQLQNLTPRLDEIEKRFAPFDITGFGDDGIRPETNGHFLSRLSNVIISNLSLGFNSTARNVVLIDCEGGRMSEATIKISHNEFRSDRSPSVSVNPIGLEELYPGSNIYFGASPNNVLHYSYERKSMEPYIIDNALSESPSLRTTSGEKPKRKQVKDFELGVEIWRGAVKRLDEMGIDVDRIMFNSARKLMSNSPQVIRQSLPTPRR